MITAEQVRGARAILGWSQGELARMANVSLTTIRRMEDSAIGPGRSSGDNVLAVQRALEAADIAFIPENGGGAGVRLAKPRGEK